MGQSSPKQHFSFSPQLLLIKGIQFFICLQLLFSCLLYPFIIIVINIYIFWQLFHSVECILGTATTAVVAIVGSQRDRVHLYSIISISPSHCYCMFVFCTNLSVEAIGAHTNRLIQLRLMLLLSKCSLNESGHSTGNMFVYYSLSLICLFESAS